MTRVSETQTFCKSSFISLISTDSIFKTCVELKYTVQDSVVVGHAAGPDSTQLNLVSRASGPLGSPLIIPAVKNDQ